MKKIHEDVLLTNNSKQTIFGLPGNIYGYIIGHDVLLFEFLLCIPPSASPKAVVQ